MKINGFSRVRTMEHHPSCASLGPQEVTPQDVLLVFDSQLMQSSAPEPCDCPGWYFFTEQPVGLNAKQLHAMKLGALKAQVDRWRSMRPGPNKDRWKSMIKALRDGQIHCRVVGQRGTSDEDIVAFEAPKPDRAIFSFPTEPTLHLLPPARGFGAP